MLQVQELLSVVQSLEHSKLSKQSAAINYVAVSAIMHIVKFCLMPINCHSVYLLLRAKNLCNLHFS